MVTANNKVNVSAIYWFTNIAALALPPELPLTKRYNPEQYPDYDNYKAIEVSKVADIPKDYTGVMGVPITIIPKWNPDQFELIGWLDRRDPSGLRTKKYKPGSHPKYHQFNTRAAVRTKDGLKPVYNRVLIKNKKPIP